MQHKFSTTIGRKVRLGRLSVPVWAIAAAGLTIAAVAGQAVGPVLTGSVSGSAGLTVSQTVVLVEAPTFDTTGVVTFKGNAAFAVTTPDDSAATMNDEGTAFTVALETQVGQTSGIRLRLDNQSGKVANAILELSVPAGIDVEVDEVAGADVTLARLTKNTWLLTMDAVPDGSEDIRIIVESKDDAAPGFYTISGRIIQVAN
ncbi:MAG: hypothetical protein HYY01_01815 [Chloroflexi bacterium]|nr:hypothetical protein [Chloroflexota bacterium]